MWDVNLLFRGLQSTVSAKRVGDDGRDLINWTRHSPAIQSEHQVEPVREGQSVEPVIGTAKVEPYGPDVDDEGDDTNKTHVETRVDIRLENLHRVPLNSVVGAVKQSVERTLARLENPTEEEEKLQTVAQDKYSEIPNLTQDKLYQLVEKRAEAVDNYSESLE